MVSSFFSTLASSDDLPRETKEVVFDLYRLFAYTTIQAESYECECSMIRWNRCRMMHPADQTVLRCGAASAKDLDALPDRIQDLLSRIRPHAVNLVDAWKFPDYLLDR